MEQVGWQEELLHCTSVGDNRIKTLLIALHYEQHTRSHTIHLTPIFPDTQPDACTVENIKSWLPKKVHQSKGWRDQGEAL